MFCDGVADLDAAERARYADLLVLIAAADGELVREEIQLLESFMGKAMVHPETRTSIRRGLFDTNRLSNLLKNAETDTLRFALRDGILLAAADGEYDRRELNILKKSLLLLKSQKRTSKRCSIGFLKVGNGMQKASNSQTCPRETIRPQNETFHDFNRHIQTMIEYPLVGADYAKRG